MGRSHSRPTPSVTHLDIFGRLFRALTIARDLKNKLVKTPRAHLLVKRAHLEHVLEQTIVGSTELFEQCVDVILEVGPDKVLALLGHGRPRKQNHQILRAHIALQSSE
jgi:hypothetical protein